MSLNKGQRAVAAAKGRALCLDNNYPTNRKAGEAAGVNHGYIMQASLVVDYTPELADRIMSGDPAALSLNEAYQKALVAKKQKAMIAAAWRKDSGRDKKSLESKDFITIEELAKLSGVNQGALGAACVILEYASDKGGNSRPTARRP